MPDYQPLPEPPWLLTAVQPGYLNKLPAAFSPTLLPAAEFACTRCLALSPDGATDAPALLHGVSCPQQPELCSSLPQAA